MTQYFDIQYHPIHLYMSSTSVHEWWWCVVTKGSPNTRNQNKISTQTVRAKLVHKNRTNLAHEQPQQHYHTNNHNNMSTRTTTTTLAHGQPEQNLTHEQPQQN